MQRSKIIILAAAAAIAGSGGAGIRGADPDAEGWYAFRPANDAGPSAIGMEDWFDRPAGKRGRIQRKGETLIYGGKPIKLWGLNLCFGNCAPDKALAEKRAAFYPKYGINSVRLHKYADGAGWSGIQSRESCAEFDADALDRMDYQVAKFEEAGIYVLLSAHFGALKLGPADRKYVPYLEEFGSFGGRNDRIATPHSAIHYSPELQDVHIRQTVNLLRHRNPYTGKTYAEDPAIAFIEIINEQSILFFTSMAPLKASPTLRKDVARRFSDWLRKRYGSQATLREAWGEKAFDCFAREGFETSGESIDAGTVLPLGNPWFWDPAQLAGSQSLRRRRLLDTLLFLYETQCAFYDRYAKAARDAGYKGEILASNWQAGRALSHLYNLHSDARAGTVDRHNYFGGGSGKPGERFNDASMLRVAGAEMLSSGLQQVADRPFMLSEWIHVFPNEWGVEGPAIIGAYGLGLQGWDVSYMFQNGDRAGFSDRIGRDRWDVTAPQVLGIFPAVARQVLRGDVKESELRATMYVHVPSLAEGKLGFEDRTAQAYDLKGFDCDKVPARALAVARCAVEFTDRYRDTPAFDLGPFERDGALVSSTKQLRWKEGREERLAGTFTIDTPGTKAVVGFAGGETFRLGDVTIAPACRFAAIYVTAAEKDATIAKAKRLVVVAMARARNTGMRLNAAENQILDRGKAPILLEPVKARIAITGGRIRAVNVLDQGGRRTDRTLTVADGGFAIDGARDRTPYYEVVVTE
ncbi:MAG: beta-galactosidase [Planctomycetes bacterium]|nr:beta-galactosidase [Planctomycetota bacterium]